MKRAEQVTFGGSGLDRAAELRSDKAALKAAASNPHARAILLWRGKPLLEGDALARLSMNHPVMSETRPNLIFLGLEHDTPRFAADLSDWTPPDIAELKLDGFFDTSTQLHPSLSDQQLFCELRAVMTRLSPRDAELAATAKAVFGWHDSHGFCAKCGTKSQASKGGWQRDCPACNASHFPRTDPVVIMLITHGNSVLMGRSPGWPEGMYSLLAGFVEPGETLEAAVRREVFEEAGIKVGEVGYLASQPWPFPSSLMFGCRGEALDNKITIDPVEIEDAMWVSREEMLEATAGHHPTLKPARKGAIAHFIIQHWLADTLD